VAPGAVPSGITFDSRSNRLFVSCHGRVNAQDKNGVLAVLDAETGKVLATPPIGNGASGVAFDPASGVILTANGKDGTVSVIKETSLGTRATCPAPTATATANASASS
jgi:DNA-binding beta-propeller fold protein YncE